MQLQVIADLPTKGVAAIQTAVTAWARRQADIRAVVLVGSWARNEARPGSDIDLVLLVANPEQYRRTSDWPAATGLPVERWRDADYGLAWSRHLTLAGATEVELCFAPLAWAATEPVDAGTARVIGDGCQILYDPDGLLARLVAQFSNDAGAAAPGLGRE